MRGAGAAMSIALLLSTLLSFPGGEAGPGVSPPSDTPREEGQTGAWQQAEPLGDQAQETAPLEAEWTDMRPDPSPPAADYAMAYDAQSDRVIAFGGPRDLLPDTNYTWAYDFNTNTWTNVTPEVGPSPCCVNALIFSAPGGMAYDGESDRIILFGGTRREPRYLSGETWAYDYNTNTWTNMTPAMGPDPRFGHSMAYDAESDRVIIFGGEVSGAHTIETWAYDYNTNTWTRMNPAENPSVIGAGMAYDAQSDHAVLFGGGTDETWAYDFNTDTWSQMNPARRPSLRGANMAYDAESDRVVLYGGISHVHPAHPLFRDTWTYDFDADVWTLLNIPPGPPLGPIVYDAESDRIILLTETRGPPEPQTWAFRLQPRVETEVTLDTANPTVAITSPADGEMLTSALVTLTGTASDDVGVEKVELSTDGTSWVLATGTTSWSSTLTLAEGENTILARATDTSGNAATMSIAVTVVPPPPGLLASPLVIAVGIGAGVAAVAAVAALLILRRRGKRKGEG